MTEPDEALLWAREDAAAEWEKDGFSDLASKCRSGKYDPSLARDAYAYRAGQAASAARIKALEYDLMWTDQAWEAAQEAVVYGYTLLDDMDAKIDAARLEGIRLGLEAAVEEADYFDESVGAGLRIAKRRLLAETIAREAVLDQLTREAQADNMGYDNEPR